MCLTKFQLPFVLVNFIPIPAGPDGKSVNDLENFISYSSDWDVKIVPQEGKPSPGHTEHSTAVVGSTIQYAFTGKLSSLHSCIFFSES